MKLVGGLVRKCFIRSMNGLITNNESLIGNQVGARGVLAGKMYKSARITRGKPNFSRQVLMCVFGSPTHPPFLSLNR